MCRALFASLGARFDGLQHLQHESDQRVEHWSERAICPATGKTVRASWEEATCSWIRSQETVLMQGPPGVGKTHLAVALSTPPPEIDPAQEHPLLQGRRQPQQPRDLGDAWLSEPERVVSEYSAASQLCHGQFLTAA